MSSPNTKKILIGVLVIVVLGAIGFYFFTQSGGDASVVTDILTPSDGQVVGEDLLVLADKLGALSIESSVFATPLFTNLKDNTAVITNEDKGRPNPFNIIGVEGSGVPTPAAPTKKATTKP